MKGVAPASAYIVCGEYYAQVFTYIPQGVVTYTLPVEVFATGIKNLDRWKSSLIAWLLRSEALDRLILREFKG